MGICRWHCHFVLTAILLIAVGVHGVSVTSTNGAGFLAEQAVFAASGSTVQRTEGLAQ